MFYGKMDRKRYHYNRYLGVVIPHKESTYVLIIDEDRHLKRVKAILLKKILTFAEMLAN